MIIQKKNKSAPKKRPKLPEVAAKPRSRQMLTNSRSEVSIQNNAIPLAEKEPKERDDAKSKGQNTQKDTVLFSCYCYFPSSLAKTALLRQRNLEEKKI